MPKELYLNFALTVYVHHSDLFLFFFLSVSFTYKLANKMQDILKN